MSTDKKLEVGLRISVLSIVDGRTWQKAEILPY